MSDPTPQDKPIKAPKPQLTDMETVRKNISTALTQITKAVDTLTKTTEPHRKIIFRKVLIAKAELAGLLEGYDLSTDSKDLDIIDTLGPDSFVANVSAHVAEEITKDAEMRNAKPIS